MTESNEESTQEYEAFLKFGLYNQSTLHIKAPTMQGFAEALLDMEERGGYAALVHASAVLAEETDKYFNSDPIGHAKNELGGEVVSETTQSGRKCGPNGSHGWMVYKTGEKNGNKWEAYMCPLPKGPGQCKPIWI